MQIVTADSKNERVDDVENVTLRISLQIELTLDRIEWKYATWLEAYHVRMNGELIGVTSRDANSNGPWSNSSREFGDTLPNRVYTTRDFALAALVRNHWQRHH